MTRTIPIEQDGARGFVLVVVALLLVTLIGFVALGVDMGALYSAKASAQEMADAAALAGAFTFINNPVEDQPATAENYAREIATNNFIMGKAADVEVAVNVPKRQVTVVIRSTQETHFAKAMGRPTADIAATATAEASDHSPGAAGVRPWFVANTVFSSDPNICNARCNPAQVLINPSSGEVTSFAKTKFGAQFTLKPQDPQDALSPGQFYEIDLPGLSGGAKGYEEGIVKGAPNFAACQSSFSAMTGNKTGKTVSGVNELLGNPPRYRWLAAGRYQRQADGNVFDMAENLVVAPIWDTCSAANFCPQGKFKGGGTHINLQMIGWSVLFVEGISGDADGVVARLVNVTSCGGNGGGSSDGDRGSSVLTLPVRLVRP